MIRAQHMTKKYDILTAVDNLSLTVEDGEIYGLVGPDGAGKTTAIRLMCGALTLSADSHSGLIPQIEIAGFNLARQLEQARAQIGYLPQRFSLYEDLTVLENLRFFAEVRGLPASQWQPRCMEILAFVGLDGFIHRRAGYLSGGMKQKLGLAVALVHRPRVLLLDEPTTGVDPVTRQDFWQLIIRLAEEEKIAVLVSTPYMDEAARCHRVGFLRQGQMMIEGTPESLRKRLDGCILEVRGKPLMRLRTLAKLIPGVENAQMFGDRLHLRVKPGESQAVMDTLADTIAAQGCQADRIRSIPAQLEDVFIDLLEEKL